MTDTLDPWVMETASKIVDDRACCRECQTDALVGSIAQALTAAITRERERVLKVMDERAEELMKGRSPYDQCAAVEMDALVALITPTPGQKE